MFVSNSEISVCQNGGFCFCAWIAAFSASG